MDRGFFVDKMGLWGEGPAHRQGSDSKGSRDVITDLITEKSGDPRVRGPQRFLPEGMALALQAQGKARSSWDGA